MASTPSTTNIKGVPLPPGLPDDCTDTQIKKAYDKGELWKTFMHAAVYNNVDMIKRLIDLEYDVDTGIPDDERNPYGAHFVAPNLWHSPTPLHVALIYGSEYAAEALVEADANLERRMMSATGRRGKSIYKWNNHTPLTWTLLGPFTNDFYQLMWDKTPKKSIEKDYSAIDDIARAGNKYRHVKRLEFLFDDENGQGTEWTPDHVTGEHILIAAKGWYETGHMERNASRENILEMLIMRAGGFDSDIMQAVIEEVKPINPRKGIDQNLRRTGKPEVWKKIERIQRRHTTKIPAVQPRPKHPVKEYRVVEIDLMLDNNRWADIEKEWETDKGGSRYLADWQRSPGGKPLTETTTETTKTTKKKGKAGGKAKTKEAEYDSDS
jgi:hypothetical protein